MAHRLIKNDELVLHGPVGFYDQVGPNVFEGFTSSEVLEALAELNGPVTVSMNSPGGAAYDGIAIYNALRARGDKITMNVDGQASSAGSIIAMAGDEINMRDGSVLMVHEAAGITVGSAGDHRKSAERIEVLNGEMARIYSKRSGRSTEAVRAIMAEEVWMNAELAQAEGFATAKTERPALVASVWDYRKYKHAPERLTAMAKEWASAGRFPLEAAPEPAANPPNPSPLQEFPTMAESPKGGPEPAAKIETVDALTAAYPGLVSQMQASAAAAERDRIKAIEENTLPGHEALTAQFKFDGKTTAPEAAIAILKAEKAKGGKVLKAMADDELKLKGLTAEFKPANDPPADKPVAATDEAGWKKEFQATAKLRAEFLSEHDYTAFKKAEAVGAVKIYAPRAAA